MRTRRDSHLCHISQGAKAISYSDPEATLEKFPHLTANLYFLFMHTLNKTAMKPFYFGSKTNFFFFMFFTFFACNFNSHLQKKKQAYVSQIKFSTSIIDFEAAPKN